MTGNQLDLLGSLDLISFGGTSRISGAYATTGTVDGNALVIAGNLTTSATLSSHGGYVRTGDAINNTVLLKEGASSEASLIGGYVMISGDANNNSVTIEGTQSGQEIRGGYTKNGIAADNTVTISGSTTSGSIEGGYTYEGAATDNRVILESVGSTTNSRIYGGHSNNGSASNNQVILRGAFAYAGDGTDVAYGGHANKGSATGNELIIESTASTTMTEATLTGGYADGNGGTANGNRVIVQKDFLSTDSKITVVGGGSADAEASSNSVLIDTGASVTSVIGGYGYKTTNVGGTDNVVELQDGARVSDYIDVTKASVTTSSVPELAPGTFIATGHVEVGAVKHFDRFVLNVTEKNQGAEGEAVLTLTGNSSIENGDVLSLAGVEVTLKAAADTLLAADEYHLVELAQDGLKITFDQDTSFVKSGTFTNLEWNFDATETGEVTETTEDLELRNGNLYAGDVMITGVKATVDENAKTLSESRLGTIAFLNQGAEFIADEAMRAMTEAVEYGIGTFAAVHGGKSNYKTGSRVDVSGVSLATGVGAKVDNAMIAGFVEAGWASSDGHVKGTTADGDHDYYGVGLMGRWQATERLYLDGAARIGWASTKFDGLYAEENASYDSDSLYGSLHLGVGTILPVCSVANLDLYGRYIFTYLESDDVKLSDEARTKFDADSTMSHAFRIGGRFFGSFNENASWRFGLAYEHVADGDAEGTVNGLALDVPTLEGDAGILELGLTVRPAASSSWSVDLGLKGYAGDREGMSGSAMVKYVW